MASKKAKSKQLQRYRKLYAKAKQLGVIAKPKDARRVRPSKYMKTKLNRLEREGLLTGEYKTVNVGPKVARAYKEAPTAWTPATFGNKVVVPKKVAGALPKTRKGKIIFLRPLVDGEHELIPIPIKATTVENMLEEIQLNPIWELAKREDEMYAFRIYGNASWVTFDTIEGMVDYIATNYGHIEENETNLDDDEEANIPLLIYREKKNWNMTGERETKARKRRRIKQRKLRSEMTPRQRLQMLEKDKRRRELWRKRYPEKYQEELKRRRENLKKRREKMSAEELARWREKERVRKRIQREGEDEVAAEIRRLKDRRSKREKRTNAKKKKGKSR